MSTLMTAEKARTVSLTNKFGSRPFWPRARLDSLIELLGPLNPDGSSNTPIPKLQVEWNRVRTASPAYVIRGPISPFYVPATYGDPAGEAAATAIIESDFNTAVDLALRWLVLGDAAAAAKCVSIITAWSTITSWTLGGGATTPLMWSNRVPKLIQAAMMISDYSGYTTTVANAFKAMIQRSIDAKVSASNGYVNNVSVWGVVFDIASSILLGNRAAFDLAIRRWRALFDTNIVRNVAIEEVYREGGSWGEGGTGLWYSNFMLYAFTVAAEWARFSGEWLYDYVGADGSTFRDFAMQVRYWTRRPTEFPYNTNVVRSGTVRCLPHDDILHNLWPDADSAWILDRYQNGTDRDSIGVRGAVLIYRNRPLYG